MRAILVTSLFLVMAGCTSNPEPTFRRGPPPRAGKGSEDRGPGPRGRLFISPMGEPFRSERGGAILRMCGSGMPIPSTTVR